MVSCRCLQMRDIQINIYAYSVKQHHKRTLITQHVLILTLSFRNLRIVPFIKDSRLNSHRWMEPAPVTRKREQRCRSGQGWTQVMLWIEASILSYKKAFETESEISLTRLRTVFVQEQFPKVHVHTLDMKNLSLLSGLRK